MLQDFRRRTTPDTGAARLAALRAAMAEAGVDAFLVPRADAHQGENVAPRDERLAWLTGFTGSAGLAVGHRATGRRSSSTAATGCRCGARSTPAGSRCCASREDKPADWLAEALPRRRARSASTPGCTPPGDRGAGRGARAAADRPGPGGEPRRRGLARPAAAARRGRSCRIRWRWPGGPPPTSAPRSRAASSARDLAAAVLTLPDSIAWLLNVRGSDIARTPVPLAFAILHADGRVDALHRPGQVRRRARAPTSAPRSPVAPPEAFGPALDALRGRVGVDQASAPVWVSDRLADGGRAEVVWERDPCILPKACKTAAEIAGARAAHLRDGAAMAEFLAWLDLTAPEGGLTEIDVVRRLEEIRAATGALRDISFDTICGAGPDGAIVHYRVTEASNRQVAPGRAPAGRQRRAVRRRHHRHHPHRRGRPGAARGGPAVHAGAEGPDRHVPAALAARASPGATSTRWPATALWRAGLDYDHGTGHGVGAYLGVHEGPQSLSRRGLEPLLPGHDPVDRARLLPRGRLRHPHREPRRGPPAARCPPGGDRDDARLRDADARARSTAG